MRTSAWMLAIVAACGSGDGPALGGDGICDPDEYCLQVAAIDGVTDVPDGRLVVMWLTSMDEVELGIDVAWSQRALTEIPLASIAVPTTQAQDLEDCDDNLDVLINYGFAVAYLIALDRPLEPADFEARLEIYGIGQGGVIWADTECLLDSHEVELDLHVYREGESGPADGQLFDLQTCVPGTPACEDLVDPSGLGT